MGPHLQLKELNAGGWLSYIFGSPRTVPSLDGLRAISVMLVILAHIAGTRNFPIPQISYLHIGTLGVRVFFVISGYLITGILLSDLRKTGDIDLKRFYFRRTMRLFPAAWVFITTAGILGSLGLLTLSHYDLLFAYTYTSNYYQRISSAIGHLWSLATEEQFYLLWPLTLKLLGIGRSRRFLIGLLIAAPIFRMLSMALAPALEFLKWSDSLGTGCLLALTHKELAANPRYQRLLSSTWMTVMPFITLAANHIPSTKLTWLFGETIQNVTIAILIHWSIRNSKSAVGRFLNLPIMASLGVLSYSLYLWQQLFSVFGVRSVLSSFPVNVLMMLATALASYVLIEKPFLRLREKMEPRWWPARSL